LPPQVIDLTDAVKLKWAAQALQLEKIVLKKKEMVCYFPSDQQSSYYESSLFSKIMMFISSNPTFVLKQTPKFLTLNIPHIHGIMDAEQKLRDFEIR
jgi:transcription-repair coupling factor (superfamily II helicase)